MHDSRPQMRKAATCPAAFCVTWIVWVTACGGVDSHVSADLDAHVEATDAAAPAPDADILDAPDLAAADAQVVPDVLGDDGDAPDAIAGLDAADIVDAALPAPDAFVDAAADNG